MRLTSPKRSPRGGKVVPCSMATTLRLTDAAQKILNAMVAEEGLSQNEVIQRAILERAARSGHKAQVKAAFTDIDDEYAHLFERLRQA